MRTSSVSIRPAIVLVILFGSLGACVVGAGDPGEDIGEEELAATEALACGDSRTYQSTGAGTASRRLSLTPKKTQAEAQAVDCGSGAAAKHTAARRDAERQALKGCEMAPLDLNSFACDEKCSDGSAKCKRRIVDDTCKVTSASTAVKRVVHERQVSRPGEAVTYWVAECVVAAEATAAGAVTAGCTEPSCWDSSSTGTGAGSSSGSGGASSGAGAGTGGSSSSGSGGSSGGAGGGSSGQSAVEALQCDTTRKYQSSGTGSDVVDYDWRLYAELEDAEDHVCPVFDAVQAELETGRLAREAARDACMADALTAFTCAKCPDGSAKCDPFAKRGDCSAGIPTVTHDATPVAHDAGGDALWLVECVYSGSATATGNVTAGCGAAKSCGTGGSGGSSSSGTGGSSGSAGAGSGSSTSSTSSGGAS